MKSLIRALMEKQSTPPFPFFPTPAVPMEGDKASLIILIEHIVGIKMLVMVILTRVLLCDQKFGVMSENSAPE